MLVSFHLKAKHKLGAVLIGTSVPYCHPQRPCRRLTIASSSDVEEERPPAYSQSQSLFFSRLLPEIREKMYLHTLGENIIHLVPKVSRLGHIIYTESSYPNPLSYACWCIRRSSESTNASMGISCMLQCKGWSGVRDSLLNLLQTYCRIYSEAVHVLYAGNTSDMMNPGSIVSLADTVLPHLLKNIRSIYMSWLFVDCQPGHYLREQSTTGTNSGRYYLPLNT